MTIIKRSVMCSYGNCQQEMETGAAFKVTVTVAKNGKTLYRQPYCCYDHASLDLAKEASRTARLPNWHPDWKDPARGKVQP